MKDWLKRFKTHPLHCLSHIVVGGVARWAFPGEEGAVLMGVMLAYQFGSGLRKQDEVGKVDTIGLDCVDYGLGYIAAAVILRVLAY